MVNLTTGGDGGTGVIPWNKGLTRETDERVNRTAKLKEGKTLSDETKRKKSIALKGRSHTKEHNNKIAIGRKKRYESFTKEQKSLIAIKTWATRRKNGTDKVSKETREKIRQVNLGKKHSGETKRKMSSSHKGKLHKKGYKICEEKRKNMKKSEETKQKLSIALKNKPWTEKRREAEKKRKNEQNSNQT